MSNQQLFNDAYLGLKAQDFEQSISFALCKLRGANGLKCAIGHCLPDHLYQANGMMMGKE